MPTKPMDARARLGRATRTNDAGCQEWILSRDRLGYGRLKISLGDRQSFRFTSAHRFAWELTNGPIPDGMNVLHACDNRACCNPAHLFLGTQKDNMIDMHAKGRGAKGYRRDPATCSANAKRRAAIDTARKAKP